MSIDRIQTLSEQRRLVRSPAASIKLFQELEKLFFGHTRFGDYFE
jgi:hypothetical protein